MAGVHLDSARANLPCGESTFYKGQLNRLHIFQCRGSPVRFSGMRQTRGAQRRILRIGAFAAFLADGAFVPQLQEHPAVCAVNGLEAVGPSLNGRVGNAAEQGILRGGRMVHGAGLRDDQPHAAFHPLAIVIHQARQRRAVVTPHPLHAGHDEPVR